MAKMAIQNKKLSYWVMVMMPVSSIVKRQRFLNAITAALLRNGLRNPSLNPYSFRHLILKEV